MARPELVAALTLWLAQEPSGPAGELLQWDAPASCPTRERLVQAIAGDLGRPLTEGDAAAVRARASARRRGDRRWELSLTIEPREAPSVQRTVVAARCELLVEVAALMIAVVIDPDILAEPHDGAAPTSREPVDIPLAAEPAVTSAPCSPATSPGAADLRATSPSRRTPSGAVAPAPDSRAADLRAVSPSRRTPSEVVAPDSRFASPSQLPPSGAVAPDSRFASPSQLPPSGAVAPDSRFASQPEAAGAPRSRPAPCPAADPPASPVTPAPPAPSPAPGPSAPRLRAAIDVSAGLDVGALPRPAPGFMARLGLLGRRVRGEVGALHFLEQSVRVAGTGGGGDLRLTAARLAACPRFAWRRVELPVCGGLELGAMRGEGVGVTTPTSDRVLWLAALADVRVQWIPLPRLALGLQVGLAVPLLAARFRVRGLDADLHRAAPVSFRGGLALELRFP